MRWKVGDTIYVALRDQDLASASKRQVTKVGRMWAYAGDKRRFLAEGGTYTMDGAYALYSEEDYEKCLLKEELRGRRESLRFTSTEEMLCLSDYLAALRTPQKIPEFSGLPDTEGFSKLRSSESTTEEPVFWITWRFSAPVVICIEASLAAESHEVNKGWTPPGSRTTGHESAVRIRCTEDLYAYSVGSLAGMAHYFITRGKP